MHPLTSDYLIPRVWSLRCRHETLIYSVVDRSFDAIMIRSLFIHVTRSIPMTRQKTMEQSRSTRTYCESPTNPSTRWYWWFDVYPWPAFFTVVVIRVLKRSGSRATRFLHHRRDRSPGRRWRQRVPGVQDGMWGKVEHNISSEFTLSFFSSLIQINFDFTGEYSIFLL